MAQLTVAQAAEQWIAAKRVEKKNAAKLKTAAKILKEHFRKSGRSTYKDQISYAVTPRTTLDTEAVRAELGDRVQKFEKTTEVETLALLG